MSAARAPLRPWGFVVAFGTVSLLADFVYEGARSVTGPLLGSLGASAAVIGAVTGAGDAAALGLRLVSGPLADRTRRFWTLTIAGYLLTVVSVPPLGVVGTLWAACVLVVAERVGKAVRSPAKDTLLSHATAATGRGRGFAVAQALDQTGALIGPLTVAGVLAATGGDYAPALLALAAPGAAMLAVLLWLRARVPNPAAYEPVRPEPEPELTADGTAGAGPHRTRGTAPGVPLPRAFWLYAAFTGVTTCGLATFGVLSFHLVHNALLPVAAVPVLYAGVMLADALSALATGWAYDRFGSRALVTLPLLTAAVPALAFTDNVAVAVGGAVAWGAALGVQESTLLATVADLVPAARRATAYGVFAGVTGAATLVGGALTGALYGYSIRALIITVAATQAAALVLLAVARRSGRMAAC
ncbi:MFS transporter [Streptantibioticus ferralitis]|uniref:MFS transporter n=1 Tax=Streptantibioticus ferralitis TaxID=236510 RepID=A0ABT5Z7W9_9ACTN|nr:MFS transporter [Streptantibioticus ferralitis]MDF2259930.1 MFS transporter [Streptantibioticus ferralitis]